MVALTSFSMSREETDSNRSKGLAEFLSVEGISHAGGSHGEGVFHWGENCGTSPPRAFLLALVLSTSKKILIYSTRPKAPGSSPGINKNQNYRCWLVRQDQDRSYLLHIAKVHIPKHITHLACCTASPHTGSSEDANLSGINRETPPIIYTPVPGASNVASSNNQDFADVIKQGLEMGMHSKRPKRP